jgi:uncharacterized protein YecT (DUF1311 family)
MSRSFRFPAPLVITLVIASLALAGCSRDAGRTKGGAPLAADTMLARDIARASGDTSGFTEAADIAQNAATDTLAYRADSAQADTSPSMRVPNRTAPSSNSPTSSTVAAAGATSSRANNGSTASTLPAAATPAPARRPAPMSSPSSPSMPASASSGASSGNVPLDASCNSPALPSQRRCLLLYLAKSDETLDRNYQALISDLKADAGTRPGEKEPPRVTRLRVAQRAWLVYRDNECRRRNRGLEGPLWAPMRARCLAEYSAKRADELVAARNR